MSTWGLCKNLCRKDFRTTSESEGKGGIFCSPNLEGEQIYRFASHFILTARFPFQSLRLVLTGCQNEVGVVIIADSGVDPPRIIVKATLEH